jgi:large subunit ribosomal protein L31
MKEGIHPEYKASTVLCACGNEIVTRSVRGDFHIEICAACHPFFTGKQKIMDTAGRIERFKTRYAATPATAAKPEPKKAEPVVAKKAEAPKENRAAKRAKSGKAAKKSEAPAAAAPAEAPAAEAKPAE